MIEVIIGQNANKSRVAFDPNTTLRDALESQDIDYSTGTTQLDGSTLRPGDIDRTFASFGVTAKCVLLNIAKADNA